MKKIKIVLAAFACTALIGTAVAGFTPFAPGDYYDSPSASSPISGVKGEDWDCNTNFPLETCAYFENEENQRIPLTGRYTDL